MAIFGCKSACVGLSKQFCTLSVLNIYIARKNASLERYHDPIN